ncbi:hypothetical protein [Mucilaginibacter corticis]|uniref:hypothetical protein n=1 Tax=Mucilaginibacter corticis TaxID=2597670 RepID=UPI00164329EA|nr:hypothetical protein [Mucilaginibacter corticis]
MTKTILGIILFLVQIGLALFYNQTVDLIYIAVFAVLTFVYILYKYFTGKYKAV